MPMRLVSFIKRLWAPQILKRVDTIIWVNINFGGEVTRTTRLASEKNEDISCAEPMLAIIASSILITQKYMAVKRMT